MTKRDFLAKLKIGLSKLPPNDVNERLDFYSEMIDDLMEEGLSEEVAVDRVGSADDVVFQILNETKNVKAETIKSKRKMKTWEIALLIVGSPVWVSLLIAAFAALCSLYISIWSVIIALWAIFGSFVGVAFGGLAAGTVFTVCGNAVSGIALIGAGIILAGLSIFLFFGCKAATEGISLLTKKIASKIKSRSIKKEVV
jgi:uncharacterized membrane protein